MSDSELFRHARMALAAVIEQLPYGDPLSRECEHLIHALREHEYALPDPVLSHPDA